MKANEIMTVDVAVKPSPLPDSLASRGFSFAANVVGELMKLAQSQH